MFWPGCFRAAGARAHKRGLLFEDRELKGVLRPGRHWVGKPFRVVRVDTVSVRDPWIERPDLDVLVKIVGTRELETLERVAERRASRSCWARTAWPIGW